MGHRVCANVRRYLGWGHVMIGFRIAKRTSKASADMVARFSALPVANISDCMSRMIAGGARLRPMHAGGVMAGPAFTVRSRPGDNLMLHKALDLAEPGDIIVCDAGGDVSNALIGELMVAHAIKRRLGGMVINGAIRDASAIRAGSFPVFAAGVTHRGPYKDGPGEINVAIAIDGMVIEPGDIIVGDDDGFVSVPYAAMAEVLKATEAKNAAEEKQMAEIKAGTSDRSWIDATLKRLGCRID
jgi:regulator of RNase E activity RraA